jgi:anthranilate phosphoribosyltransferase
MLRLPLGRGSGERYLILETKGFDELRDIDVFQRLTDGADLTVEEARSVFERIMAGQLDEALIGALLGALLTKGECVDELVGAGQAMRASALRIQCDAEAIDTCGTGGDGISTFNVSTTAAIIAAAAGATVAKHGNRSSTRVSGSTEVLTELGINVDADRATVERCLREVRIGYLNARVLHPAMKYAAPVRQAIPVRTIFNLLGPLTNPAGVRRQLVGVPRLDLVEMIAEALRRLGTVKAWVVHGSQGLCDLTVTGPTTVVELRDGALHRFTVTPEDVGLRRGELSDLLVGSPVESAARVRAILGGEKSAARDHALLNSGAALVVAGLANALSDGVSMAAGAVDDGRALATLERWRTIAGLPG